MNNIPEFLIDVFDEFCDYAQENLEYGDRKVSTLKNHFKTWLIKRKSNKLF